ncbi:putative IMPACT family member YvyE [Candidatus Hydrogenisulfobacillus filiaventi]|uniref:Putative IMPACT family member YvyE n=1 Tax=Candidatus Hydrogenisulfobacillus filiaventi TaxID=2707344 RepID=A0A6F8ZG27_9FIRM|nr:putative IMPACT family member YvyE [Candidatus Hydrogenisulfobacillus filiaventi]
MSRSRFIAAARHLQDAGSLDAWLDERRQAWPRARHYVWAYRLEPGQERATDDHEPAGTAGAPLLELLRERDLVFSGLVVVRYFGGIKLGRGGLARAHREAALATAPLAEWRPACLLSLVVPYAAYPDLERRLAAAGLSPETEFGSGVALRLWVLEDEAGAWETRLTALDPACRMLARGWHAFPALAEALPPTPPQGDRT